MDKNISDRASFRVSYPDHPSFESGGKSLVYPCGEPPGFGGLVEVAEGLFWTRMPLPSSLNHINLYLLKEDGGYAIVDTGMDTSLVRETWDSLFDDMGHPTITRIIVTHYHPDHLGQAGWLVRKTGAPLYMSHGEYQFARALYYDARDEVPEEVLEFYHRAGYSDEALEMMKERGYGNFRSIISEPPMGYSRLREGLELEVGGRDWRMVTGRGHSPEHICLYNEEAPLLISGDQVLPRITSNISVYPNEPLGDPLADWLQSLRKLSAISDKALVLPAHNEPFFGLHHRLETIAHNHERRLELILGELETPKTVMETLPALFKRRLTGFDFILATGEAIAHVHFLERRGFVSRELKSGRYLFRTEKPFDKSVMEEEQHGWP